MDKSAGKCLTAMFRMAVIPMILTTVFASTEVNAAGLGKLRVSSGLGEPLNAEIDVISATPAELDTLEAKIASDAVYESQGVDRPSLYNAIRTEIKKKASGTVLKLSTREPVTEPYLDMLIQMDWGSGQLLREYNVLLDPPGFSKSVTENKKADQPENPVASNESSQAAAKPETNAKKGKKALAKAQKSETKPEQASSVEVKPAEVTSATSEAYTTHKGDTLSSIAKQHVQDGVNLDQYMVAMYRANQDAFVRNNINRLKVGQIIKMPATTEAQSISPAEARKEVVLHTKDWNAFKNNLAAKVANAPESGHAEANNNQGAGTGKIVTDAPLPQAQGEAKDVVKLSKGESSQIHANNGKANQEEIAALKDELTARDNAVKEANTRVAMLEKRISDMEKLLTIKSQAMASAQQSSAEQEKAEKPKQEESKSEPLKSEPPKAAEQTPSNVPQAVPEVQMTTVVTPPPQEAEKPSTSTTTAEGAEKSNGMMDIFNGMIADPVMLGGAGGALALLGGAWLYVRRRQKRDLNSLEKAIVTTGGVKENTVFGSSETASLGSGTTSFLTDFSQTGGGMIDAQDVDPIAEAEVYMAYGRDAQAEEILKDAIAKDPKRAELKLKLLELYASRKDVQAFEPIASELYSNIGGADPIWHKVATLGRGIDAGNPLYQNTQTEALAVDAYTTEDTDLDLTSGLDFGADMESLDTPSDDVESNTLAFDTANASYVEMTAPDSLPDDILMPNEKSTLEFASEDMPSDMSVEMVEENEDLTFSSDISSLPPLNEVSAGDDIDSTLELPSVESAEEPSQTVSENSMSIDADLQLDMPEIDAGIDMVEMPALPEDNIQEASLENASPLSADTDDANHEMSANSLDTLAMDLDLPDITEATQETLPTVEELSAPDVSKEDDVFAENLEMTSDLTLPEPGEIASEDVSEVELADVAVPIDTPLTLPEMDFSKIDLDLGVGNTNSPEEKSTLMDEPEGFAESTEVETKLDLVTAYIDMGDKEGAQELLEEVIKEGGPQQRARAQELLSTL